PVHRTGHWDSATPYAGSPDSWMHKLRNAGINTTSIGKLHYRSTDDDNGWSDEILPMHVLNGQGWTRGLLRGPGETWPEAAELAADVASDTTEYTDYDAAVTKAAETWLQSDKTNNPFALWVSFLSPHYPLTARPEYLARFNPDDMDDPIGYAPDQRPDHPEIAEIAGFFSYDIHFNRQRMKEARAAYYALTAYMDDNVARVLKALEASGKADDTLVIYCSDHGELLGDHGLWTKQVMYEGSAGAPLILSGPGIPAGQARSTAASLLDIYPTALAAFGLDASDHPGDDLAALANAPDDPNRTAFSEYHDGGSTTASFMVRWGDWKYVHYVGHRPQLFNLIEDPDELTDRASDPSAAATLAEGEARLRAICNPEEVNKAAFDSQRARIKELGGPDACRVSFNHTPAPTG
ncbi:MAG: sulfatase-like hydrolase/transferase, partial [Pikeienuella sp.]